jgi:hypothetical protein
MRQQVRSQIGKSARPDCFKLGQCALLCAQILGESYTRDNTLSTVDMPANGLNNLSMPRPDAVRRVKSYSAATGYVYQYYFYEVEKTSDGAWSGTEYVYMVSVDRQHVFPVRIFVAQKALQEWSAHTGQQLTGTEEYAIAKMRLFQAFDEIEGLDGKTPRLMVDHSNLEPLLLQLDL